MFDPDSRPERHPDSSLDVLLVAAFPTELRPFARRLGLGASRTLAQATVDGLEIGLITTGMGRPSDDLFRAAIEEWRPMAVINVGIAGALDLEHPAGSAWIVDEWRHSAHPHGLAARADADLSASIGARLDDAGVAWQRATAVSVDEPLHDADERDRILAGSAAHLVEMEGAPWAAIAAEYDIPFAAIRVVSDHANRSLPGPRPADGRRAKLLRDDGTVRIGRIAWAWLLSGAWLRPRHHYRNLKAAGGEFAAAIGGLHSVAAALLEPRDSNE